MKAPSYSYKSFLRLVYRSRLAGYLILIAVLSVVAVVTALLTTDRYVFWVETVTIVALWFLLLVAAARLHMQELLGRSFDGDDPCDEEFSRTPSSM